jgi:hypothetical protein
MLPVLIVSAAQLSAVLVVAAQPKIRAVGGFGFDVY